MCLKRTVLALFAGLLLAAPAFAQGTGRSLDIQPGARENGMGAAGVALAEDATGMTWWNPAGLGFAEKPAVQLTYAQLVPGLADDVTYNYVAYVQPVEGWGAFGVGIVVPDLRRRAPRSDRAARRRARSARTSSRRRSSTAPGCCPTWPSAPRSSTSASSWRPQPSQGVGQTFGIDVAAPVPHPGGAACGSGANLQNLGPSVTFINEDEASPLSRNLKTGFAWEALQRGPASARPWRRTSTSRW